MRQAHYVKGNKNCEMPSEAIWVDTETKPKAINATEETHHLKLGFASYSRANRPGHWTDPTWLRFTRLDDFWTWVESKLHGKIKLYIFAHNWAFDFPVLNGFEELVGRGWKLTNSVINSPPIILKFKRGPHSIVILDTLNIWRVPLKAIGEKLNLPKLTMPKQNASKEAWDTYAKRDVEIIMAACFEWWRFLKDNDLGGFAPTLAAQSFRTFRHRFMEHKILIDSNQGALDLARLAFHGGRTEAFFIGDVPETIYKLDINSMYPHIMAQEAMPTKLIGIYNNVSIEELTKWNSKYCVIAEVHLQTEVNAYPIIQDEKLLFPVGRFTTHLCTPEIAHALEHGHVRGLGKVAVYEKEYIFKPFIDYFYKMRLEHREQGNTLDVWLIKILMNSLFGKFGQHGMNYNKVADTDDLNIDVWIEFDIERDETFHYRKYGGIIEELQGESESRDSHPAIAAHVTAYARMLSWETMQQAGRENVYYTDTDSFWVNKTGYDNVQNLLDDERLGFLKLEGIHDDVTIYGPKDYCVDGKETIKGIKKNARKLADGHYEQVKFTTLKGLLRRGDLSAPVVSTITKQLTRLYTKGKVLPSGRVEPFTLG